MKIYKKKKRKKEFQKFLHLSFIFILYYIIFSPFYFIFVLWSSFLLTTKKIIIISILVDFKYQPNNQNHNNFFSLVVEKKKGAMTKRWGKKQYKYVYMCIYHRRFYLFLKFQYFFSIYLCSWRFYISFVSLFTRIKSSWFKLNLVSHVFNPSQAFLKPNRDSHCCYSPKARSDRIIETIGNL